MNLRFVLRTRRLIGCPAKIETGCLTWRQSSERSSQVFEAVKLDRKSLHFGFPALVEETLTVKRITKVMSGYQFWASISASAA
jgi:hypothetical protein